MRVLHSMEELAALHRPVHWAMGFFDGVHRGHRRVVESAATPGALRGVLTFAEHPLAVLAPQRQPMLITPLPEQKMALLEALGVEVLLVLPFTRELAAVEAVDFLERLRAACPMAGISVGENWKFGARGAGDAALVRQYAAQHGLQACVQPMAGQGGENICSTRIRRLLAAGNMPEAEALLGHSYTLCGMVETGQKLARTMGFPTANMRVHPHAALLPAGVYAVEALLPGGGMRQGIANLGRRPTIAEAEKILRLEAHFPHWQGDLYGQHLCVSLRRFLRAEQHFASLAELQAQIRRDVASLNSLPG
ncbi:MAG: riboflavin biosynthesis protein RibF [Akkermansia sp.]|nr:riboflavin biosynthesis protein RibF [Akkermansia sp.]